MKEEAMVELKIKDETDDGVLKVVEAATAGGKVIVTVEGTDLERLMGSEARNLAYEQRMRFGMANGGIEAVGGTYVPVAELKLVKAAKDDGLIRGVRRWHRDFSITQMI